VRPGRPGSWEDLFHNVREETLLLALHDQPRLVRQLALPLLQRAIGVIYRPETERWSHYFHARLSQQFDAVIHFDHTRAVEPLERTAEWDKGELPDTYPSAV
ncbi:MAG: erythromycin esterase family protein, partial [Verrucomicrobiota bacterium]